MNLVKVIMTGVLATVLTSATFAAVPGNDTTKDTTAMVMVEKDAKPLEIKVSELPEAVQEALKSDAYEGWKAEKAFVIQKKDKKVYKVEVTKGEEKTTLLFNEDGEAIEK